MTRGRCPYTIDIEILITDEKSMGRSSKRKGSTYEREFVHRVQDHGIPARRVPLSGAMSGYPDDVVVDDGSEDGVRVECKFRAKGTGFKRLYDWIAGYDELIVEGKGVRLTVTYLEVWCAGLLGESGDLTQIVKSSRSSFAGLRDWICESGVLAVRMPRSPWLVITIEEVTDVP